jgi:photosystem II stability/assembly factor-like uncharacterized protein
MSRLTRAVAGAALALVACGLAVSSVDAGSLTSLVSGKFVPVAASMLPTGAATYDDATCPSATRCYVVGTGDGGGILTTSSDSGRTWSSAALPRTSGQTDFSISCPSVSVCYVGGTNFSGGTTLLTTRNSGTSWSVGEVPTGQIITSIGCGSANSCIALGSNIPTTDATSILTTSDGGKTWVLRPSPTNGLVSVRCVDAGHCWAAGEGAWFTADLGATWSDKSPPLGPPCHTFLCTEYYSKTIDVEFQSRSDGWVVGGNQCGGMEATYCEGVAFHTTDAGATWTISAASQSFPFGWQIACQSATCVVVDQGFTFSVITTTTDNGSTFSQMQQLQTSINALACTPTYSLCIAAGGNGTVPALLTLGTLGASPPASVLSTVGGSLATPSMLLGASLGSLVNALITVGLILLITFPSQLFNRTYDENHTRIRAWWEHRMRWLGRMRRREAHVDPSIRGLLSFTVVLAVGGVLAATLDPGFGMNLRSLALFIGAVLAIVAGVTVSAFAAGIYRRSRHHVGHWRLRALPSALLIAAACVLVSRVTDFQPGYLYGLIGGVVFTGRLNAVQEGHEVAVASVGTLAASIGAWLLWVPVSSAAAADPSSFGLALVENFLAALFLSGMVGLVISLVPLRFLPGERVAQWHWGAWAVLFGVACLAMIDVMLRPQTRPAHASIAPFWTTLGLFLAFGVASVLFWAYFKVRSA